MLMVNFLDATRNAVRDGTRTILGNSAYVTQMFLDLAAYGGLPREAALNIPGVVYRFLFNQEPPSGIGLLAFPPGECPTEYRYSVSYTIFPPFSPPQTTNDSSLCGAGGQQIFGPVSRPRFALDENGFAGFGIDCFDTNGIAKFVYVTARWNPELVSGQINDFSLFTCSGDPDECGEPEAFGLDEDWFIEPVVITYNDIDNNIININADLSLSIPYFDNDFTLSIPFTLNINDPVLQVNVPLNGNINITNGDINFNFGGNGFERPSSPGCNGYPENLNPLPDIDDDGTDDDDVPLPSRPQTERVMVGAIVTSTGVLPERRITVIGQDDNPDIYAPALGYISFRVRSGIAATAWTTDIPVKNRRQAIQCPWFGGAIDVRGTPMPGVTWQITPVYETRTRGVQPLSQPSL